jgi:hypothetical protein
MSSHSFYAAQTLDLYKKYKLSENAKSLLKALDDYQFGRIDEAELGRLVRLSPNMRKAITETIARCAKVMGEKPAEMKNCIEIIQNCTVILSIAGTMNLRPPEHPLHFISVPVIANGVCRIPVC